MQVKRHDPNTAVMLKHGDKVIVIVCLNISINLFAKKLDNQTKVLLGYVQTDGGD